MSIPDTFDQSSITQVNPPTYANGMMFLSWVSTAPNGTWYQIYENRQLFWVGQKTSIWLPIPTGPTHYDIGTVGPDNINVSFADDLPVIPQDKALLTWEGGTFEGQDIAGFHVYSGTIPGGSINYTVKLATITAYPQGVVNDGFGMGGFGDGGFGESASYYSWESNPLASGTWNFGVKAFDVAGNEGTAATVSVLIIAPPLEPSVLTGTSRVTHTYSAITHKATITWGVSPSA